jgi:hypothetical protein
LQEKKRVEDWNKKPRTKTMKRRYGKGDVPWTHDLQCYTTKDYSPPPISFGLTWNNYPIIFSICLRICKSFKWKRRMVTILGHELVYQNENKVHIVQDLSIPL